MKSNVPDALWQRLLKITTFILMLGILTSCIRYGKFMHSVKINSAELVASSEKIYGGGTKYLTRKDSLNLLLTSAESELIWNTLKTYDINVIRHKEDSIVVDSVVCYSSVGPTIFHKIHTVCVILGRQPMRGCVLIQARAKRSKKIGNRLVVYKSTFPVD